MNDVPIRSSPSTTNHGTEVDVSGTREMCDVPIQSVSLTNNMEFDSSSTQNNVGGKTCHQCRQIIKDVAAICKNPRNGKPCVNKVCQKCLKNRYGEMVNEVNSLTDWNCPKCRGICNCSCCRRNNGLEPTGALSNTAKASGFKSVSEMLINEESMDFELNKVNNVDVVPSHEATLGNDLILDPSAINDTEGGISSMDIEQHPNVGKGVVDTKIVEKEIPLPTATEITAILDIELRPEDVGNALQFLEFCRVFGEALDIEKGEGEAILQSLIRKQNVCQGESTLVVELQSKLLTLIVSDSRTKSPSLTTSDGNNSWLKILQDLIIKSDLVLKEFPIDWLNEGIGGYYDLDISKKLTLLNFICDEALGTTKLRSYIDDQNVKYAEKKKEAKCKVAAAKEKEKSLKKNLRDEMEKDAMSNVDRLSISEPNELIVTLKSEASKAHTEFLEAKDAISKWKQSSDAIRIEPEFSNSSGQSFWKLKSYNSECDLLMQDITLKQEDATLAEEKWLFYGPEQKDEIDMYINSRTKRNE
ncbi:uncharacterized protein LOC131647390 [Vicia villosa]|uniref:uncharacterized protein LOC131647390 n=1 Tax=Vicia villosa TaxID=3911 RepID=UPI00273CA744|nr:uncharacterized protein LOC131647390 [Vicia villosa]